VQLGVELVHCLDGVQAPDAAGLRVGHLLRQQGLEFVVLLAARVDLGESGLH
jgi:hypothetical protein